MAKLRKMLGEWQQPEIQSIVRLVETQSKTTIAKWCLDYAESFILPVYEKTFPEDLRPRNAINAAREWILGNIKLPAAKKFILECHAAARETEKNPSAQAAARAIGQSASCIHAATHCIGLTLYGAAAIAYDRVGTGETAEVYDKIACEEFIKMEAALRAIALENEPNPAKLNWNC
jgi:hypothetical protein